MLLLHRFSLGLVLACLSACEQPAHQAKPPPEKVVKYANQLERVKKTGILTVLTRYDPTTYYETANGFSGLEYDLVQLFAEYLQVESKFIVPDTFAAILQKNLAGDADFAAAGISITEERKQHFLFTPPYQEISEQVIFRSGTKRPKNASDLVNGILEIVKGTSHTQALLQLKKSIPQLEWQSNEKLDTDGLLYLVNERFIDYTIADSNQMTLIRRFYPKLNVAFNISPNRHLAWAFKKSDDLSLYNEAVIFFDNIKKNQNLEQLIERHYGHTRNIKYVGNCTFRLHLQSHLPQYQQLFQDAADKHEFDWRLLAAISYQESHWDKEAVSPTGVKGLMMLTQATAEQLNVTDRTNPQESIFGGALYLKQRLKKIPARILEPDRTWFALASYNIGFGHLEDARIVTQKLGKNPDKWIDVKQSLPLLTKQEWFSKAKHGYARGKEPVIYVDNIRSYLDLLLWYTSNKQFQESSTMSAISDQNNL
ncbi:MAG: membrane-bound lytic murein transglycosylase MltF [Methyloprofundus sp.]|uniref:membrane-bound lytic murein transglycosylase MltF n=1 Tax=Methyloprofundus sp. TaxID=2020875 RepID=UPI002613F66F|nr:membrane-bound lytic murein transglycosylase MltF [Methyloprofundus sp.]